MHSSNWRNQCLKDLPVLPLHFCFMSPINSVTAFTFAPVDQLEAIRSTRNIGLGGTKPVPSTESFGKVLEGLLGNVVAKDEVADAATRSVLLGDGAQLHQAMIAGAESDVAFGLMVEVRNKLLESYQELMRMQL